MESEYSIFGSKKQEPPISVWARTVLQVGRNISKDEIKGTYRTLSKQWHPDMHIGKPTQKEAEKRFGLIDSAYKVLYNDTEKEKAEKRFLDALRVPFEVGERFFCLGVLYGRRIWYPEEKEIRIEDPRRLLAGRTGFQAPKAVEKPVEFYSIRNSILEDDLEDLLHVYYGGMPDDKREIKGLGKTPREIHQEGFEKRFEGGIDDLPWIKGNNLALHYFMQRKFSSAVDLMKQCNELVKRNGIFMYREGVCLEARAAENKSDNRSWIKDMAEAIRLYESAIELFPKPKSKLTIMMQLADAYGEIGNKDKAGEIWREIRNIDPGCFEAIFKSKERLALTSGVRNLGRKLLGLMSPK